MKSNSPYKNSYNIFFAVLTILVIAIIITVNIIAGQLERGFNLKLDLTETRIYSLSDTTKNVLADLDEPINIYTLFETGEEDLVITEILEKYVANSDSITVSNVDPTQNPGFTTPFDPQSKGISSGSVIVTDAENNRYKVLGFFDLYQAQYTQSGGLYVMGIKAEQSVSSAINYIKTGISPRIMFLSGHGETATVSAFINSLTASGYEVEQYSIFEQEAPLDPVNDTLMIISPKQDLTDDEYSILNTFLSNGGNAMFFMDSVIYDTTQNAMRLLTEPLDNFNSLLMQYDITINTDLIVGETASSTYQKKTSLIPDVNQHMITAPMLKENRNPVISDTSSISVPERPSDVIAITPLLTTVADTYSKQVNMDLSSIEKTDTDMAGPFVLCALAEKNNSQIIAFSTSAIVTTDEEFNLSGNKDLITSSVAYLNQREESIAITPKSMAGNMLQLKSNNQRTILIIIVIVLIPLSVLIMGFVVWINRKRS